MLKLSLHVLWKGFEVKSHQTRAHYLNRNGGQLAAGGGAPEVPQSPSLIRVKWAWPLSN